MRTRLAALEIAGFESVLMMVSLRPCPILGAIAVSSPRRAQPWWARQLDDNHTQASSGVTRLARTTSELGDQLGIG